MKKMSTKEVLATEKKQLIEKIIDRCLVISGYSHDELAIMLGMGPSTLYYRQNHVDSFKLFELMELCRLAKLDDETRLMLLA